MSDEIPRTIPQLWHLLDRRLILIEEAQKAHCGTHAQITKELDDHEQRLRSAGVPGHHRRHGQLIRLAGGHPEGAAAMRPATGRKRGGAAGTTTPAKY